jgi:GNAT superfamily N-acetyltransferase
MPTYLEASMLSRRDEPPSTANTEGRTMTTSTSFDIQLLPPDASADAPLMRQIAELVNRVYALAETGQWLPGATRTTVEEVTRLTGAGEIVVARHEGVVVGSVRVQRFSAELGEYGMLVSDPDRRDTGIGRALQHFVIDMLRREGFTTLQVELLTPRDWHQPSKQFMADWNERSGYKVVRKGALEELYPDLAPLLATPCDFIIYHMDLQS